LVTVHRKIVCQLQIAYLEIFQRYIWLLRKAQFLGYWPIIIFVLRISQLFNNCQSTNYFITGNRLNIWLHCIEKLYENFTSPISKHFDYLCGYCAKPIFRLLRIYYLAIAHLPIFYLLQSTNYFTTGDRLNIWLMCIQKLYDNFKSPI
jgi:hypothetical protein